MPFFVRPLLAAACVFAAPVAVHAQWDVSGAPASRYADPAGRFSLLMRPGWQPAVKNGAVVFQWNKTTLTAFFRVGETQTGEMLDAPVHRVRETAEDYRPKGRAACRVGPYQGATLEFTADSPEGVDSHGRIVTVTNGQDGMAFVLLSPSHDFKDDDAAMWDAVSTLAFGPRPKVHGPHLAERTPILLTLGKELKSGREHKGAPVWFTVAEPVRGTEGNILIAKGATAFGTVLRSEKRRMFGKPGKLEIGVNSVQAVDGTVVPLRATENLSERGRSNADVVTATALLLTPLTVFVKGRDVTMKEGTGIVAYVNVDTPVQPDDAAPGGAAPKDGAGVPPEAAREASDAAG